MAAVVRNGLWYGPCRLAGRTRHIACPEDQREKAEEDFRHLPARGFRRDTPQRAKKTAHSARCAPGDLAGSLATGTWLRGPDGALRSGLAGYGLRAARDVLACYTPRQP